ncbi:hypothetical protein ETU10_07230 [Apibacter muscae]|uniref:hypothetical protein n=1 Tax=Apibacter muscae TaxID=2509004 RepID=UPI0011AD5752|nr:hypothetical protein [Apibacter muscae]TWP23508.1 hypothetical protein ETU10_07230 [Apibacter muscae]
MKNIFDEISQERNQQNKKWGEQNHNPIEWISILTEEVGEVAKEAVDAHFSQDFHIKTSCLDKYRKELIQVAAVVVAMAECLDRNKDKC